MKILHTSDWHLGRQLHHQNLLADQRHVLDKILEIVKREKVEVVLISGDIYDRSVPPADAVELLDDVLQKMNLDLKVPVVMIAGNHDGPERLSFGARQLARSGLHIVGNFETITSPVVLSDTHGDVAFYGIPYADPVTVKSRTGAEVKTHDEAMKFLIGQIQAHNPKNRRCVVLSHCFLTGGIECESERPLTVGGAGQVAASNFKSFHYTALGHLHGPQSRGNPSVRYSGSILKYSFSEANHKKTVTLIDLDEKGECQISEIPLEPLHDLHVVEGKLDELLAEGVKKDYREDYLLVRLLDTHAILDAMGKLRAVFPNVLHLERPGLMQGGLRKQMGFKNLNKSEFTLFQDFYKQMTDLELDDEATEVLTEAIAQVHVHEHI